MSGNAHSHRIRRGPGVAGLLLLGVLAAAGAPPAHADQRPPAQAPGAKQPVVGEVIDITGVRERPRGDTRLPWAAPEGFARSTEDTFSRTLHDEVIRPVDREELRRLLEVERRLH